MNKQINIRDKHSLYIITKQFGRQKDRQTNKQRILRVWIREGFSSLIQKLSSNPVSLSLRPKTKYPTTLPDLSSEIRPLLVTGEIWYPALFPCLSPCSLSPFCSSLTFSHSLFFLYIRVSLLICVYVFSSCVYSFLFSFEVILPCSLFTFSSSWFSFFSSPPFFLLLIFIFFLFHFSLPLSLYFPLVPPLSPPSLLSFLFPFL